MKRNLFVYIGLPILSAIFLAFGIVLLVLGGKPQEIVGGVFLLVLAVFALLLFTKIVIQDNLNIKCGKLCEERRYDEEKALIEKKMKSPFFFLVRTVALMRYVRVSMALDDLPTAKRYIDRLRHGGGAGWKYMTAYFFILIKLDEGDIATARTEYEEFRTQCAHAEIYREQIEVLGAIFRRLFGAGGTEPLPKAAVESPFPVVSRVLGRVYEARSAAHAEEWGEGE